MDLAARPLDALVNAHFLVAGPVLGLAGWGFLRIRGEAQGWRPAAWLMGAKVLSTALVFFPLTAVLQGWLPGHLGENPLARLPWILGVFAVLLCGASALLEWPFFHRARRGGAPLHSGRLSLGANAMSLLILAAVYLPFCRLSLLDTDQGKAPEERGIQVFYLRDGGLFQRTLAGAETRLSFGLETAVDARIFARRGAEGWDLWIQERDRAPRLIRPNVAPTSAKAPAQPALFVKLKPGVRTAEPALPETYGKPAEAFPEFDSAWSVDLGRWSHQGLRVQSRALGESYDLALDTPFLAWEPRGATRLPDERLLFQMGPYLWLLDLETKRLQCFARGQGAQVFLSGSDAVEGR